MTTSTPTETAESSEAATPHHLIPNLIYWPAVEGFQVYLSEDGVHLKTDRAVGVEPCDLERLLEVIDAARAVHDAGVSRTPTPPDPSSFGRWDYELRAKYAAQIAANSIKEAYGIKEGVPF